MSEITWDNISRELVLEYAAWLLVNENLPLTYSNLKQRYFVLKPNDPPTVFRRALGICEVQNFRDGPYELIDGMWRRVYEVCNHEVFNHIGKRVDSVRKGEVVKYE